MGESVVDADDEQFGVQGLELGIGACVSAGGQASAAAGRGQRRTPLRVVEDARCDAQRRSPQRGRRLRPGLNDDEFDQR